MKDTYNGWKNRATWNVALWINNSEKLYEDAKTYVTTMTDMGVKKQISYFGFVIWEGIWDKSTPDDVQYLSHKLCFKELDQMIREIE